MATCLGIAPPTIGLAISCQSWIKATSQLSLLPRMTVGCVKLIADARHRLNAPVDFYTKEGGDRMKTSSYFNLNIKLTWALVTFAWDFWTQQKLNAHMSYSFIQLVLWLYQMCNWEWKEASWGLTQKSPIWVTLEWVRKVGSLKYLYLMENKHTQVCDSCLSLRSLKQKHKVLWQPEAKRRELSTGTETLMSHFLWLYTSF